MMAKTTVPQAHAERQILTPFGLIGSFDAEPLEHDSFEGSLERTARTKRIAQTDAQRLWATQDPEQPAWGQS